MTSRLATGVKHAGEPDALACGFQDGQVVIMPRQYDPDSVPLAVDTAKCPAVQTDAEAVDR